jgi:hypothetical protein
MHCGDAVVLAAVRRGARRTRRLAEFDSRKSHQERNRNTLAAAQRRSEESPNARQTSQEGLSRRHGDTAKNTRRRIRCLALRACVAARAFRSFWRQRRRQPSKLDARLWIAPIEVEDRLYARTTKKSEVSRSYSPCRHVAVRVLPRFSILRLLRDGLDWTTRGVQSHDDIGTLGHLGKDVPCEPLIVADESSDLFIAHDAIR